MPYQKLFSQSLQLARDENNCAHSPIRFGQKCLDKFFVIYDGKVFPTIASYTPFPELMAELRPIFEGLQ